MSVRAANYGAIKHEAIAKTNTAKVMRDVPIILIIINQAQDFPCNAYISNKN